MLFQGKRPEVIQMEKRKRYLQRQLRRRHRPMYGISLQYAVTPEYAYPAEDATDGGFVLLYAGDNWEFAHFVQDYCRQIALSYQRRHPEEPVNLGRFADQDCTFLMSAVVDDLHVYEFPEQCRYELVLTDQDSLDSVEVNMKAVLEHLEELRQSGLDSYLSFWRKGIPGLYDLRHLSSIIKYFGVG